ncbi:unnamed protein product [Arabis nemorensis]|uniref:Uncharacterized protein n=1 Tax=Arabis nemorensis TaxID=586526 RepID=A0A565BHY3_9BRAS|nr:unnamed protein product [Arabis nemorensis]
MEPSLITTFILKILKEDNGTSEARGDEERSDQAFFSFTSWSSSTLFPRSHLSRDLLVADLLLQSEDLSPEIIASKLKTSLSETLSGFYPLAGRIEGVSISCNDEGAVFTEARTDLLLPDFLRNINMGSQQGFSPTSPGDSADGLAIVKCHGHFLRDWATTTAKGTSNDTIHFAETTIYPPHDHVSLQLPSTDSDIVNLTRKCVTNRFVFDSSKIAELKRKAASETVPLPTRVEAISALLWRCARNASRSNKVLPRPTLMFQAMDLRLRIPSTRDMIGNLQTSLLLKKEVKPDIDLYTMTSWCRKPFYKVDFGWGSPVWLGSASHSENMVLVALIDSKDGDGVEAWINLPEQDMTVFLHDQDLLAYAVLNPPVLV